MDRTLRIELIATLVPSENGLECDTDCYTVDIDAFSCGAGRVTVGGISAARCDRHGPESETHYFFRA